MVRKGFEKLNGKIQIKFLKRRIKVWKLSQDQQHKFEC